jgi:lipoic acid synthetase
MEQTQHAVTTEQTGQVQQAQPAGQIRPRRPDWLKIKLNVGANYTAIKDMMSSKQLHTVCEEAQCPNIYECWSQHKTATFMILGDICTRACRFCAVKTGLPTELDLAEPERVAEAVQQMGLRHCVVTSVARDDLRDGGASIFAAVIHAIRRLVPECTVEVLIPDFLGNWEALAVVMEAKPDILNHNIETVRRLSNRLRAKAKYERTLELLRQCKRLAPEVPTKSSVMLGVGETMEEVRETMADLRAVDCDIVTFGQYLQPTRNHYQIARYVHPDEFAMLKEEGLACGFKYVESGPLVRSSYHAHEQIAATRK